MTIGERFKEVRKLADTTEKKCSQGDFGKMFEIGRDAVANIENGRVEPSKILMENICNRFEISYEWLAYEKGDRYPKKSEEEEIADMVASVLHGTPNFKQAVVKMICTRTPDELQTLEKALMDILANIKKE